MQAPFKRHLLALLISASLSSAALAEDKSPQEIIPSFGFAAALELAKQNDPELKYALYTNQAQQEEDDIGLSNLLPNVSFKTNYRYSNVDDIYTDQNSGYYSSSLARSKEEQSDYTYQLSLQQSLVNVAASQAYSSSKEVVRQSQYTFERAEQELIYRLTEAYLKALLAAQQTFINEEKLDALELRLAQTQRMEELGVGDKLSVLRVTANRDVARSDLLQAKSKLADAQTQLEIITGKKMTLPENWVKNSHKVLPSLQQDTQLTWLNRVADNSQILAAQSNVRSKELEASAREANHLPTLDFSLSMIDRHTDDVFEESTNYIASLDLIVPIYTGGKISAQARQSEASYNAAQARYEKLLSDTQQTVKLAYSQLNSFHDRLEAIEESRKSSQAFVDAAERQADLSLGSQVEVLEARTDLYDVRLEFVRTLSDYLIADLNLLLETGQLNDKTLEKYDLLFDQKTL